MADVPWRRYRVVRKASVLHAIEDAVGRSGGTILERPSPDHAPFKYVVRTPGGAQLTLLCYAFLANKYRQRNRPADEHRFQIKYGSDFHEYHHVYFDPSRAVVTLMFGVHLEEDVFVAIDPAMNNPTWFSRSVEVKSGAIQRARE